MRTIKTSTTYQNRKYELIGNTRCRCLNQPQFVLDDEGKPVCPICDFRPLYESGKEYGSDAIVVSCFPAGTVII